MRPLKNHRGSALISSLIAISVLFILFLSAFSYGIARYSVHVRSQYRLKARYLAESGVNRVLHMLNMGTSDIKDILSTPKQWTIDRFGTISINSRPFGAYLLLESTGKSGSQQVIARALIGTKQEPVTDYAVVITDPTYPLTVSGRTRIIGDILTGPQSVTTGVIDGQGIYNDTFLIGNQMIYDSAVMVSTSSAVIENYLQYISDAIGGSGEIVSTSLVLRKGDEDYLNYHSVFEVEGNLEINGLEYDNRGSVITILVGGTVEIKGESRLGGLIEIVADNDIIVRDNSVIDAGLFYTQDSLILRDKCYFRAQGIAEKKLVVRDDARIDNPSLLLVVTNGVDRDEPHAVYLGSRKKTSAICAMLTSRTPNIQPSDKIFVDSLAFIEGTLFSSGYTDLRGALYGSAITGNFYYYQSPTTYINWLRNVVIDRSRLTHETALPLVIIADSSYGVFSMEYY